MVSNPTHQVTMSDDLGKKFQKTTKANNVEAESLNFSLRKSRSREVEIAFPSAAAQTNWELHMAFKDVIPVTMSPSLSTRIQNLTALIWVTLRLLSLRP